MFPPLPGLPPPPPGTQPPASQPQPPLQPPAPGTEVSQPVSSPPVLDAQKKDGEGDGGFVEKAATEAVAAINASIRPRKRTRSAAKFTGQQSKAKRTKVVTRSTSSAIKEGVVRPEDLEGGGSGLSSGGEKDAEGEVDIQHDDNDDEDVRNGDGNDIDNGSGDESSV